MSQLFIEMLNKVVSKDKNEKGVNKLTVYF
jgi:hypothetical protein